MTKLLLNIINLNRRFKKIILILFDILIGFFSFWFSYCLRLEKFVQLSEINLIIFFFGIFLYFIIAFKNQFYSNINRYFNINILISFSYNFLYFSLFYFFSLIFINNLFYFPRSIGILFPLIFYVLIIFSRFFLIIFIEFFLKAKKIKRNTLIFGTSAEAIGMSQLLNNSNDYNFVGFLSDNIDEAESYLEGKKIIYKSNFSYILKKKIQDILICKKLVTKDILEIRKFYSKLRVRVLYTPSYTRFLNSNMQIIDEFDPDINSLLNRDLAIPIPRLLNKNNYQKSILITGAAGSIGNEIFIKLLDTSPSTIYLLDSSEFSLFLLKENIEKLGAKYKHINIKLLLGNLIDYNFVKEIFQQYKFDTIYHAAAYKHVELVENNPISSIKNNIISTYNLLQEVKKNITSCFVLISTDKAVKPTNIMGKSKRICELLVKTTACNQTKFSIVRFGNVLASSGSVINIFKKQISQGGPVTLTHRDVSRYFMSIQEAADLVIQAGAISNGNDLFALKMGEPIKIYDILKRLVNMYGLQLNDEKNEGDIPIEIIGLKKGEKIKEELFLGNNLHATEHPLIEKSNEYIEIKKVEKELNNLVQNILSKNYDKNIVMTDIEKIIKNYS